MKTNTSAMVNFVVLFYCTTLFAQQSSPFFEQQKLYVRGNSVLIGNTVLGNEIEQTSNSTFSYNSLSGLSYVDIDDDATTFNSTSASFTLPVTATNIKYAGLYWAGLLSSKKYTKNQELVGEREGRLQEILLKINDGDYKSIVGQVVYDSQTKGALSNEMPYSCYTDITSQIENQKGTTNITVANLQAITDYLGEGAAAGWLLYIIYEDATEKAKHFTSYTGLKNVDTETFTFKDLNTKNLGEGATSVLLATLKGDTATINGGLQAFMQDSKDFFYPLAMRRLFSANFNHSEVGSEYNVETTQTPDGYDPLGFNLLRMDIPVNEITKNTTNAFVQFSAKKDNFHTFFIAFETEADSLTLKQTKKVDLIGVTAKNEIDDNLMATIINDQSRFTKFLPLEKNNPNALTEKYNSSTQFKVDEIKMPKEEIISSTSSALAQEFILKPITKAAKTSLIINESKDLSKPVIAITDNKKEVSIEVIKETPQVHAIKSIVSSPIIIIAETKVSPQPVLEAIATLPPVAVIEKEEVVFSSEILKDKKISAIKPAPPTINNYNIKVAKASSVINESKDSSKPKVAVAVKKETILKEEIVESIVAEEQHVINVKKGVESSKKTNAIDAKINNAVSIKKASEPKRKLIKQNSTNTKSLISALELLNTKNPLLKTDEIRLKKEIDIVNKSKAIVAADVEPGYYLVARVFNNKTLAVLWRRKLDRLGYNPQMFTSSQARQFYIFIEKSMNIEKMIERKLTVMLNAEMEETMVYKVNL